MSLTKKDLHLMINEAIKNVIIKEIKPMLRKTIQQEFYKIIQEAESAKPAKTSYLNESDSDDDLSMVSLLNKNESEQEDSIRSSVGERLFSKGPFADILNETAEQYYDNDDAPTGKVLGQREFVLNTNSMKGTTSTAKSKANSFERSKLVSQLGYGDGFDKVGRDSSRADGRPSTVALPETSPDGAPINFDKVPAQIVQNMMKDYSTLLKKVDQKTATNRGK